MKGHLDLTAGIAGDMFLGACLDLGLELPRLEEGLRTLPLGGWSLEVRRERRGGMAGTRLEVRCEHHHEHRHLGEILAIIDASALPATVQGLAKAIFMTLAEAEGAVHGVTPAQVHFHEVGAVDAIVDICGAALAVELLGLRHLSAGPMPLGHGVVGGAHGVMPVPVPAVAEIIRRHHVPTTTAPGEGELVTPTGAAIVVNLVERFGPPRLERIDWVGCGLGGREVAGMANLLRILAQEEVEVTDDPRWERVVVLSAHIDDMNPEWYGRLWEVLQGGGALDVALIPLTMKKGRPGVRLEVVAAVERGESLARQILKHTTTLGVRRQEMERLAWRRHLEKVETPWGLLRVKRAGGRSRWEYEDLVEVARSQGWGLPEAAQRLTRWLGEGEGPQG